MRFKTLSLALLASLSLARPAAAFFEANVAAGYTILNPSELNDALAKGAISSTPIKSGYYLSADAGVSLLPVIKLVPRVVYVAAAQGSQSGSPTSTTTVDSNIVPLELGLAADLGVPLSGLSARVGAWAGYGLATLSTGTKYTNGNPATSNLFQGSAFTAELLGAFRYDIMPFVALSLEAGYRLAKVAEMKDTSGNKLGGNNSTIAVDFSGANLGGGLTFSF